MSTIAPIKPPVEPGETRAKGRSEALPVSDPEAFATWLAQMDDEAVCGFAVDGASCPLARYLADHNASRDICVSLTVASIGGRHFDLPRWATHFILAVDAEAERAVRAGRARSLLEQVRRL